MKKMWSKLSVMALGVAVLAYPLLEAAAQSDVLKAFAGGGGGVVEW
ncbi:hypothetical protein [Paenibacillus apiarius]|uniref:Uncharacterized protein n=1 Tax=Paenibacillus apiarius TaxID=46240 RepID=A0ABT4DSJ0_9BACL|nr:hypothetical protein [Paenibacillus apiarius]MCY9514133.1 hypothetical protein [Paenibacillus apiarius]MCY9520256.1 hypothetical protein [Paenibacillus apiarius]MCY9550402.1 hypothetical protein [Paenibacillus apiarius]MCY9557464.1 hypothetical protein [Paenibacillus apiarius]MCY9682357.1 hypothetical protein [Paenibacillus apiarius]